MGLIDIEMEFKGEEVKDWISFSKNLNGTVYLVNYSIKTINAIDCTNIILRYVIINLRSVWVAR